MSGSLKEFVALSKKMNHGIVFTECFLHREALISKSVLPEAQNMVVLSAMFFHGSCRLATL
jgi:hypothetical protein